jgi:hypothetical protein
MEETDEKWIF